MALLSDVDWVILLAVAGLLFFGRDNRELFRKIGRYYGQLLRAKQGLLAEVTRSVDLPMPTPERPLSVRSALFGLGKESAPRPAVPLAAAFPLYSPRLEPAALTWVNSVGPQQWSRVGAYLPDFDQGGR